MLANHLNRGGIAAYMLGLCRFLVKDGDLQFYVASRGGELEHEFVALGIKHIKIPLKTKCEVSLKVFFSFFKLFRLTKNEIDLIHANTRVTQVLAALLSFFSGKPYISTCHGFFKTRFFRRFLPCWGQKVIAISDQVADHLVKDFHVDPGRVVLIYNGVDVDRFAATSSGLGCSLKQELGLDPAKKIIGHIGRLSSVKGQKYLILAARELLKKRRDIQFLIIGDGKEEAYLKALIQQDSLGADVLLCPSVADTANALSIMDIFVMPSIQEGLGISILEAQASGVAVVGSKVGGIPTVIQDGRTGLLCGPKDVSSLVASLETLLDQKDLRDSIITNAKAHVREKFSLRGMAEKTRDIYKVFYPAFACKVARF